MERVCFFLQVKKERLDDYLKAHQVWPEMLDAMKDAGIRNYSLFYRPDGLLVGYLEAENVQQSLQKLGQTDINKRWQEHMAEFFEGGSGDIKAPGLELAEQHSFIPVSACA